MTSSFRKILCVVLGCDFFFVNLTVALFLTLHTTALLYKKRKKTDVLSHILGKAEDPKEALLAI